jgi:hypothetical protein
MRDSTINSIINKDFNNNKDVPKIVGKIDLDILEKDKKERINFEKMSIFLKKGMNLLSKEVNEKYAEYGPVLEEDGSIKMEGKDSNYHKELIMIKESAWAKEEKKSIKEWKEKKDKDPAVIAEMMITLLLHNKLKDRFLVSRSSIFDDYENGVDYVLMDKETGAVVCGLDQVLGIGKDSGSFKKKDKIENILLRGGARLEYGLTLADDFEKDNDLIRKKIKNIPAFFLGVSKNDLDKMLASLQKEGIDGDFSEDVFDKNEDFKNFSQSILKNIIDSLGEQYIKNKKMLEEKTGDDRKKVEELLKNFDKFKESLDKIKGEINKINE